MFHFHFEYVVFLFLCVFMNSTCYALVCPVYCVRVCAVVIERDRCSKFDTLFYENMIHELFYRHMSVKT